METRIAAPRGPEPILPEGFPLRMSTLFVGPVGGGKTIALAEAVRRLVKDDADTQVFLASKGPSGPIRSIETVATWQVRPGSGRADSVAPTVSAMNAVIDARSRHDAPESLPPLVLVVDDCLQELLEVEALATGIEDVVRRGRSLGVLVYATSQSLWLPWVCMALPWGFQVVHCEYPRPPRLVT